MHVWDDHESGLPIRTHSPSSPTRAPSSGTDAALADTAPTSRKPHMAKKGVKAMAISGLWLSSGYAAGLRACNTSASALSGWA